MQASNVASTYYHDEEYHKMYDRNKRKDRNLLLRHERPGSPHEFPQKSPLHNLIRYVLCLRVDIAFWRTNQKFQKFVWHIRPDLDQNTG